MRPREIPSTKPSAFAHHTPQVLLRSDKKNAKPCWLPNGKKPGNSKHLSLRKKAEREVEAPYSALTQRADSTELCTEKEQRSLAQLEEQLDIAEANMSGFVEEFYTAAATFVAQSEAHKKMLKQLMHEN
uniref:AlNc14C321G10590 protein n=1 Tax=Albugo laibachii Nc14 TaxID=890382 RepID=F0WWF6_9STRA|nr:AlNc14C321G10590 [Albugo laibachii Nc14]|eukprot:CCA25779.1 AlNc14C321G10590 [Albugo laibachii Nc14]